MGEKVVGISLEVVRFLKKNNGITIKGLTPVVSVEELVRVCKEFHDKYHSLAKAKVVGRKDV